ncbi:unnamed protein product [Timema podura]|uniref:Photosystem II subunit H n=1 Tax=Timema podura TaxID=61482 RepID=A0ABN7PC44_TIMPD|nr:unnamed protein product [Timema podura]
MTKPRIQATTVPRLVSTFQKEKSERKASGI